MAEALTPGVQRFLKEKVLICIATVMKDGSPQVTPVWVDTDGKHIIFNTAEGRTKTRNLGRDSRVGFTAFDPQQFNRMLYGRGRVVEITTAGAWEHINELSQRYSGRPYPNRPDETRLKVLIEPTSLTARGMDR